MRRSPVSTTARWLALTMIAVVPLTATPVLAGQHPDSSELRAAVTAEGVFRHLQALNDIATAHGGERASGTPGYEASVRYVVGHLEDAGYEVTVQPFDFPFFDELSPPRLERVSPAPHSFTEGTDFLTMLYSGSGNVTAPLQAVADVQIPPGPTANSSASGCDPAHFAGFTPGNVALIQRGSCFFRTKALNAQAAGASAVIIFNEGQPGRQGLLAGTLVEPGVTIPVLGTTFAVGEELFANLQAGPTTVHVFTDTISETRVTWNVLGESSGGDPNTVTMAGAHLDSVLDSPGMNDNASGTGAILEIAIQMSRLDIEPANRLRFAFWGAEELGLLGSEHYVGSLSAAERDRIAVYLNFDVVASTNGFPFVYTPNGDNGVPPGSWNVTGVFEEHFDTQSVPFGPTPLFGASDQLPFLAAGITSGGLFSGATGIKTEEQAIEYGGVAGQPYDDLINSPGDTIDRINQVVLFDMSQAAAHGIHWFAFRTPTGSPAVVPASGWTEGDNLPTAS